jgi:hypothetical protein
MQQHATHTKTIAAYGTTPPTLSQRMPNLDLYRTIETLEGTVNFYNDKSDGSIVLDIRQPFLA